MHDIARVQSLVVVLSTGLAALQVCVFHGPAFRLPFVFDDFSFLNRTQAPGWLWSGLTLISAAPYRPVLYVVFGLLHSVFGLRPAAYHVAGAALVLAAAGMIGLVSHRLGLGREPSPLRRSTHCTHRWPHPSVGPPPSTARWRSRFGLGAVYLLLPKTVRPLNVVVSSALFTLALITREVVTVVPLMLVVARLFSGTEERKKRVRTTLVASAPLWAVLGMYVAARRLAGYQLPTTGPYVQRFGTHALANLGRLTELATDVAPARDGVHRPRAGHTRLVGADQDRDRGRVAASGRPPTRLHWDVVVPPRCSPGHLPQRPPHVLLVDLALAGVAVAAGTVFEVAAESLDRHGAAALAIGCVALFRVVVSHDTAQQHLRERLYAYADITTEFVHGFCESVTTLDRTRRGDVIWCTTETQIRGT